MQKLPSASWKPSKPAAAERPGEWLWAPHQISEASSIIQRSQIIHKTVAYAEHSSSHTPLLWGRAPALFLRLIRCVFSLIRHHAWLDGAGRGERRRSRPLTWVWTQPGEGKGFRASSERAVFCCTCDTYRRETILRTHAKVAMPYGRVFVLYALVRASYEEENVCTEGAGSHTWMRPAVMVIGMGRNLRPTLLMALSNWEGRWPRLHTLLFTPCIHATFLPGSYSSSPLSTSTSLSISVSPLSHLCSPSSRLSVTSLSLPFLPPPISVSPRHLLVFSLHPTCSLTLTQSTIIFLSPLHFLVVCFREWKQSGKAQPETDIYEAARLSRIFQVHVILLNRTSAGK